MKHINPHLQHYYWYVPILLTARTKEEHADAPSVGSKALPRAIEGMSNGHERHGRTSIQTPVFD
jgi:hypothetical protein